MNLKLVAKLTLIEMLRDRGYSIPSNESFLTNKTKIKDVTFNNVYINEKTDESLYVHFFNVATPIKDLESFVEEAKHHDRAIIIGIEKIDKKQQAILDELGLIPVEMFSLEDLLYNVTHNINVPKHEKIPSLAAANINELPWLLITDPVVRYYGWQTGDIIKIYRQYDLPLMSNQFFGYCVVKSHL